MPELHIRGNHREADAAFPKPAASSRFGTERARAATIRGTDAVRIDKWICAARFFKTRGVAAEAVLAGHVHLNGARVKPSKDVRVGDELEIRSGTTQRTVVVVVVVGLSDKRGPAKARRSSTARLDASRIAREQEALQRKLAAPPIGADLGARPTKQDRRRLDALRRLAASRLARRS